MNNQEKGLELAQNVISRIFIEMSKDYAKQNRTLARSDSFAPFLAEWDSNPRLVASALAMSRLPFFCDNVRKSQLEAYNDAYQGSFLGSAETYFDELEDEDREKQFMKEFCEYGAAANASAREELSSLAPTAFREIDRWAKDVMNGDTLGGCYGRHCITAYFENGDLTLAYNPVSEDESGSLAVTDRKGDIVIFRENCNSNELTREDMDAIAARAIKSLDMDFSLQIRQALDLPEKREASPKM